MELTTSVLSEKPGVTNGVVVDLLSITPEQVSIVVGSCILASIMSQTQSINKSVELRPVLVQMKKMLDHIMNNLEKFVSVVNQVMQWVGVAANVLSAALAGVLVLTGVFSWAAPLWSAGVSAAIEGIKDAIFAVLRALKLVLEVASSLVQAGLAGVNGTNQLVIADSNASIITIGGTRDMTTSAMKDQQNGSDAAGAARDAMGVAFAQYMRSLLQAQTAGVR